MFDRTDRSRAVVRAAPVFAALAALAVIAACSEPRASTRGARVKRGEYLVTIASCNDCHTPFKMGAAGPEPDMSRRLSGHPEDRAVSPPASLPDGWTWAGTATNTAFAGPWGVSYAANLTPDTETGAGIYTEQAFIEAMRHGKHLGHGRPILPPMPWPFIGRMTDDDLRAVHAYLRSIPPIRNRVPEPIVSGPPSAG